MLRWWLANGDAHRAAKEAAGEDGAIPDALDPPEILDGFHGWWEDFWRLTTERQIGFGVGQIPQREIDRHIRGWNYEDAEMFEHCIREMDRAYMMKVNSSEQPSAEQPDISPRDAFRAATSARRGR